MNFLPTCARKTRTEVSSCFYMNLVCDLNNLSTPSPSLTRVLERSGFHQPRLTDTVSLQLLVFPTAPFAVTVGSASPVGCSKYSLWKCSKHSHLSSVALTGGSDVLRDRQASPKGRFGTSRASLSTFIKYILNDAKGEFPF